MSKITKRIKYTINAANPRDKLRFGDHVFTFDDQCSPIPQDVPLDVANRLLELVGEACCHYKLPWRLFEEVKTN